MKNKICLAALGLALVMSPQVMATGSAQEPAPPPTNLNDITSTPDPHSVVLLWQKLTRLGAMALEKQDFGSAESLYREALDQASVLGKKDPRYLISLNDLAEFYLIGKSAAEAEPLAKQLVDLSTEVNGLQSQQTMQALTTLAKVYATENKQKEAEETYKKLVSIDAGKNTAAAADALSEYALLLVNSNRASEAEPLLRKALSIREAATGPNDPSVAGALNNLAEVYVVEKKTAEAIPLYERALRIWDSLGTTASSKERSNVLSNLGIAYKDEKHYAEAKPLLVEALSIDQRERGPFAIETAMDLYHLAAIHQSLNELGEAEIMYKQALPVLERKLGTEHHFASDTRANLSQIKTRLAQPTAAMASSAPRVVP
jgi:tetratricopeptide (TPR) repeat protein